jgi:selenophosphate synthase
VFAVSGVVSQRHLLTNWNARPGDWLVLTKPLGTGTIARIGTERFPKTRLSILSNPNAAFIKQNNPDMQNGETCPGGSCSLRQAIGALIR